MNSNPKFTIAEISEALDVDKEITRGLVKFLEEVGLAEFRGERRGENTRRVENLYSFVDGYEEKLSEALKIAKLTG